MASLRHVRRLHLADDVLPVAVDGVLAYFESGAYRLALQSLAHHVHDGYFAFAQQLLLVDVNLPFLARERILHYCQLVGLRCDVEEADGVAHAALTIAFEVENAVACRYILAVAVCHAHSILHVPVERLLRVQRAHKLAECQFLQLSSALVVGMYAAQYLLLPYRLDLLVAAYRLEAQQVARLTIIYVTLVGAQIAQYGDGVLAYGVCFGDGTQLLFLVLLQSAVHLLAQLLIQFVVYLYHSILLSVANLEHAADNYK